MAGSGGPARWWVWGERWVWGRGGGEEVGVGQGGGGERWCNAQGQKTGGHRTAVCHGRGHPTLCQGHAVIPRGHQPNSGAGGLTHAINGCRDANAARHRAAQGLGGGGRYAQTAHNTT